MPNFASALSDFYKARRKAKWEQLWARMTGKSADLLSYDDIRHRVRARKQIERGLQDIPLNAIVGSVGRYKDFTRSFLPKDTTNDQRWARVKMANSAGTGLPPIEVYKLGDVYFVLDGNHRVSIARDLDVPTIQAYVTEVETKVSVTADMDPDDLIISEQYATFLEETRMDEIRPDADLQLTVPGKYDLLQDHIEAHRYFMGLDLQRDISWTEAAGDWYDNVYLPVVNMIKERGLLNDFDGRTETDLYVWLAEHRAELEAHLGWDLSPEEVVEDLTTKPVMPPASSSSLARMSELIWETIAGGTADSRSLSEKQHWERRLEGERLRRDMRLFADVLVTVGLGEMNQSALDQALIVARKEHGQIRGIHFKNKNEDVDEVTDLFEWRINESPVPGRLAYTERPWAETMCDRARWNDLVVVALRPPGMAEPWLERLTSDWRTVLQYSPRPVLLVPHEASNLTKLLLSYDGSRRADKSLYATAYLAGRWEIPVVVLTVGDESETESWRERANHYLQGHNITADFVSQPGDVAANILVTMESHGCDFLVMGGYSHSRVVEVLSGDSLVDDVIRNSWHPVLLCR